MSSTISRGSAIGAAAVTALLTLAACTRAPAVSAPPPPPEPAASAAAQLPGGPPAASLPGGPPPAAAPASSARPSWPGRAVTEWMETHHWTPASRDVLVIRRGADGVTVVSMQPIANPPWMHRVHAAAKPAAPVKAAIKPAPKIALAPAPKPAPPPKPVVASVPAPAPVVAAPAPATPAPAPSKFRFVWPHFDGFSIKGLAIPGRPMLAIPGVGKVHSEKVVLAGILIAIALLLIAIGRSAGSRKQDAERRRRFRTFESAKPAAEHEA